MVRVTIGMVISLGNNERWRFPTIFFERWIGWNWGQLISKYSNGIERWIVRWKRTDSCLQPSAGWIAVQKVRGGCKERSVRK
jgi:hypothetical protein